MQKIFITFGIVFVIVGIFWKWVSKIPFFKLPGDIIIENDNFKFYFPIVTMILISAVVSLVFWIIKKL
ncbi:MAG: hypothetical protein A2068_11035 [Ignavibacteria bacterium GWB2_35_6b]|nr:MAG: hypothetical protein A2068_11035 [Ignavibacteria bacterium GWB2_35_6b]